MSHSLWHTIRLANGTWPFSFGDVQAQTDQHGSNIGWIEGVTCATNQGSDLHACAANAIPLQ
jgi:hypothetical protein